MSLQIGLTNHHWTGTYAFMMNTIMIEHFGAPSRLDHIMTYDNPSGFMSLQDLEDMNILADIEFSSDDELPDLI